jgi:hypothetical protein
MRFDRSSNDLGEERFRQQTCFWMIRRSSGNWTTVATDEVSPIFFSKRGHSAEFLKNPERCVDSLSPGLAFNLAKMLLGHGSAGGAHSGAQGSRRKLPGKDGHDK